MSFRNPHDGYTLAVMLEQVKAFVVKAPRIALVDGGYRGLSRIGDTEVIISGGSGTKGTAGEKRKRRRWAGLRAAIAPVIGHLKSDHRLERNFYKGMEGDWFNVLPAAAAFNFKRAMRNYWASFLSFVKNVVFCLLSEILGRVRSYPTYR